MTDQHPLTDEVIHEEFLPKFCYTEHDLRAATDWQLEQVVAWLDDNLQPSYFMDCVIKELREAMRPQEDD